MIHWSKDQQTGVRRWRCAPERGGCGCTMSDKGDQEKREREKQDRYERSALQLAALLALGFTSRQAERVIGCNRDYAMRALRLWIKRHDNHPDQALKKKLKPCLKGVSSPLVDEFYDLLCAWAFDNDSLKGQFPMTPKMICRLYNTALGHKKVEQLEKDASRVTGLDLFIDKRGRLQLKRRKAA